MHHTQLLCLHHGLPGGRLSQHHPQHRLRRHSEQGQWSGFSMRGALRRRNANLHLPLTMLECQMLVPKADKQSQLGTGQPCYGRSSESRQKEESFTAGVKARVLA